MYNVCNIYFYNILLQAQSDKFASPWTAMDRTYCMLCPISQVCCMYLGVPTSVCMCMYGWMYVCMCMYVSLEHVCMFVCRWDSSAASPPEPSAPSSDGRPAWGGEEDVNVYVCVGLRGYVYGCVYACVYVFVSV